MNPDQIKQVVLKLFSTSSNASTEGGVTTAGAWPRLSEDIRMHFLETIQDTDCVHRKLELWQHLSQQFQARLGASLHLTGSILNGFGGSSGDVDLVLIPPPGTLRGSVQYLGDARRILQETCGDYVKEKEFVSENIWLSCWLTLQFYYV